jgi:hypothetical protein
MIPISIQNAERLAEDLHCEILVMQLDKGGKFSVTTAGRTAAMCRHMKAVNDQISHMLRTGHIEIPDEISR